jgi:Na+-transporting NADH:ubiquinone oxidoreductase subunit A
MADFTIRKGFDLRLDGQPSATLTDRPDAAEVVVYPLEYGGIKQRLLVDEGASVKRGTALMEDKRNPLFKIRAPAGGAVSRIVRGERRLVEQIVIRVARDEETESFPAFKPAAIAAAGRRELLDILVDTGLIALIRQRPFGGTASAAGHPKSIFVNAMATAPFGVDANVVVDRDPAGFQAGLDAMRALTEGGVHLCLAADAGTTLMNAGHVTRHTFRGPHPAGNASVHISRVDPMTQRSDIVWVVKAVDVVAIGRLLLDGALPATRVVALGGTGIRPDARRHYRMRAGARYAELLVESVCAGEQRVINGDVLSGRQADADGALGFDQSVITVIPEGRERRFLGWLAPGFGQLSFLPAFASAVTGRGRRWALDTNRHGGHRAMVLTGLYDQVMPLDIMVDFLVRAVLAGDTEEAIKLGILETVPEDFGLCDFVCPCKTEIQAIIRQGLEQIETEGL